MVARGCGCSCRAVGRMMQTRGGGQQTQDHVSLVLDWNGGISVGAQVLDSL